LYVTSPGLAAGPQLTLQSPDLNIIFTHPDYRRQGIADIILKWGIEKAEAMGVEMWLDATVYGVPVYQKHGFVIVHQNNLAPTTTHPSAEWKEIAERLEPMIMWQMWRPVGGRYEEGKSIRPWA
jgi:GNAT superfamily N-acetyltransferase